VVWLVRHAESVWNKEARVQGQGPAPGLTAAGLAQARGLAEGLAGSGATTVVTSDLRRAVETARLIAGRLGVVLQTEPRLRERSLGSLEGGPSSSLVTAVTGYDDQRVVDLDARAPGGESLRELYTRASAWLAEVRTAPRDLVLVAVTHGGFLRVLRDCLAGVAPEAALVPPTPNGVVWRAELATGKVDEAPALPRA
jgi:probable phosphoglycerate mutase